MRIRGLINTVILHGSLIYMSLAALMGVRFDSETGAGLGYKVYMIVLFMLGFQPVLRILVQKNCTSKTIISLLILSLYLLVGFFQLTISDQYFLQMVCFATPSVCIALTIDKKNGLVEIMKWLDLLLPLFAVGFVIMIKNVMLLKIEGQAAYSQSTAYYAAYCFLITVFILRYRNYYTGFSFLSKKWYLILKTLLIPYFLIMCLFSGGRGASILLLVTILINLDVFKKMSVRSFWKGVLVLLCLLIVVFFSFGQLSSDYIDLFSSSFERVSALVEGGHVNTDASSGRDHIWADAINLWKESPLWGYGLFSYINHLFAHPHNIFIELLLQGGLILFLVSCFIFLRAILLFRKMLKFDERQIFLMPFAIYAFVNLMFSSCYWFEPFFWFVLIYIYNYDFKKSNMIKESTSILPL